MEHDTGKPSFDPGFRLLVDAIADAVLWAGADGSVHDGNCAACRLFGCTRDQLIELTRADLMDESEPDVRDAIRLRQRTGSARQRVQLRRRDGSTFFGEVTALAVPGARDQVWIIVRDLADQERAAAADVELQNSAELLRALSDASFEAVLMHSDGIIRTANRTAELYVGLAPGAMVGRRLLDFLAPEDHERFLPRLAAGDESPFEATALRADGSRFPVEAQARMVPVHVGGAQLRVAVIRDLTVRRALEEQLRQAQKMEAVGRLAGGVAHDFNNLLSVIIGSAELAIEQLPPGHPVRADLTEVVRAGDRAAGLTRQLLAFSRKQVLREQVLDLDEVLTGMSSLVRRLIGEDLVLRVVPNGAPAWIKADRAQIEQVVMNLVVNARDAMPHGGRLTLTCSVTELDADAAPRLELAPGPHATLTIADTGIGMDPETRNRLFEPFFTTKGPGRGTGLGLSTVFGIVKQSRGAVRVESTPGHGSTFTVFFPWTADPPPARPGSATFALPPPRPRSVLVVEDEPQLRRVVVRLLRHAGYEVHEARGPGEALEFAQRYAGTIDLLLSDVVMPQMNGRELADRFVRLRPDVTILLMSGYSEWPADGRNWHFMAKPIVPDRLLSMVRSLVG